MTMFNRNKGIIARFLNKDKRLMRPFCKVQYTESHYKRNAILSGNVTTRTVSQIKNLNDKTISVTIGTRQNGKGVLGNTMVVSMM